MGSPVTAIHAASDAIWAYVSERDAGLMRSVDAGATWQRVPLGLDAGVAVIAVVSDPSDARRVFAAATNGDVLRSVDGGATWDAIMRAARIRGDLSRAVATPPEDAGRATEGAGPMPNDHTITTTTTTPATTPTRATPSRRSAHASGSRWR
jgi:hypothetical protein